jgi:hypothetical protein
MRSFRPLRVLGSTIALVAAFVVLAFAVQDGMVYWHNIADGFYQWARTSQGWRKLADVVGETIATVVLLTLAFRLLGSSEPDPSTETV